MIAILLFALKGLLDQVPDVIDSAGRARDAWTRFKKPPAATPPPEQQGQEPSVAAPPAQEQEPPVAA
ncbi:hypothetical protein [Streptomyces sp. CG 926]|uniref:hypothetical protein n=1 Tax=Streptomyces sp. CG 926 TaxID=1882405 RepID=UPI00215B58DB|nr:hypothetical protein [Streptomyces sp. CG 926]